MTHQQYLQEYKNSFCNCTHKYKYDYQYNWLDSKKNCAGTTECGMACHKGENCTIVNRSNPRKATVRCNECNVTGTCDLTEEPECS